MTENRTSHFIFVILVLSCVQCFAYVWAPCRYSDFALTVRSCSFTTERLGIFLLRHRVTITTLCIILTLAPWRECWSHEQPVWGGAFLAPPFSQNHWRYGGIGEKTVRWTLPPPKSSDHLSPVSLFELFPLLLLWVTRVDKAMNVLLSRANQTQFRCHGPETVHLCFALFCS